MLGQLLDHVLAELLFDRVVDDLGAVHRGRDADGFRRAGPQGGAARVVGERLAPVQADHRIVVFEEHLVLIVSEQDHDIRIGAREIVLEGVQVLLDGRELRQKSSSSICWAIAGSAAARSSS